jgi:hypothetical protein
MLTAFLFSMFDRPGLNGVSLRPRFNASAGQPPVPSSRQGHNTGPAAFVVAAAGPAYKSAEVAEDSATTRAFSIWARRNPRAASGEWWVRPRTVVTNK